MMLRLLSIAFLSLILFSSVVYADYDDFDFSDLQVSVGDLHSGGPAKDGIPSLTDPESIAIFEATHLSDDDLVLGVTINGKSKAYPISILNWHEIVNDTIGDHFVAITWCPLTRSGVAFDRQVEGRTLEFGVSGLLYQSNVVMYDRNTNGLWSQLKGMGISGAHAKQPLKVFPIFLTTWADWQDRNPYTTVLSKITGYSRDYARDPYQSYHASQKLMFPVDEKDLTLANKARVIGVEVNGQAKAYPLDFLLDIKVPLVDEVGGKKIRLELLAEASAMVYDNSSDEEIPAVDVYWFAWKAFHPDTLLYQRE